MKLLNLKITGILLGCFLFLWSADGEALVTPEHYEKMKKQNKQLTKEPEKVQTQVSIKTQVQMPGEIQPPAGKAGPK